MDINSFENWLESKDGEAFIQKQHEKRALMKKRYKRFENWLIENNFDKLMDRLILEHNDEYCVKCHHKGYEPHPNHKLGFIINYLTNNIKSVYVEELDNPFPNKVWKLKDYYFQMTWGQGVITEVYKVDDLKPIIWV